MINAFEGFVNSIYTDCCRCMFAILQGSVYKGCLKIFAVHERVDKIGIS